MCIYYVINLIMDIFFNDAASDLTNYLYDELINIIFSYLIKFNTVSLFLEKKFHISDYSFNFKINIFNNKIYLPIYQNGLVIIYDMETDETFYLNTNLNKIYSVCNIDDNNIIISSSSSIYIYNYNVINGNINIINREKIYIGSRVYDVYYLRNNIIFRNHYDRLCVHKLGKDTLNFPSDGIGYYFNHIYLYNECLYMFDSSKYMIELINFNNIEKSKTIVLSHENFSSKIFQDICFFVVDETYFYVKSCKYINIFDHIGEFVGTIKIDDIKLEDPFFVDSKYIYMTQFFESGINLLIFKHSIKWEKKNDKK